MKQFGVVKSLISLAICAVASMPTIIYFLARLLFQPRGFWQELVLFGVGFYLLAGVQFLAWFVAAMLLFALWVD